MVLHKWTELILHVLSSLITRTLSRITSIVHFQHFPTEDHINCYLFTSSCTLKNIRQHGFIKGQTFVAQLVLTILIKTFGYTTFGCSLLGFLKEFDKVPCITLLQKLCNFGASGYLLNWCRDYLKIHEQRSNRWSKLWLAYFFVMSTPRDTRFFFTFVNDQPDFFSCGNMEAQYVDHCKASRDIQPPWLTYSGAIM